MTEREGTSLDEHPNLGHQKFDSITRGRITNPAAFFYGHKAGNSTDFTSLGLMGNFFSDPRELIEASARKDIGDLGEGLVFASARIEGGQELSWLAAQEWPEKTIGLLLLLDLWIQNEDRSLTELGGNPNLLVEQIPPLPDDDSEGAMWKDEPRREMLWAYDFNLAFDPDFNRERFFGTHVFGKMLKQWPEGFREQMEPLLKAALAGCRRSSPSFR